MNASLEEKYCECRLAVTLPTLEMAQQLRAILEVDAEISPNTSKQFEAIASNGEEDGTEPLHQLVVTIRAPHLKGLRVAVSSFLEYLQVALKCFQEFA
jgi:Transcription factor Pcc1